MLYKKPHHLKTGDTVAVLSPSWGGPAKFPAVYENGLKVLSDLGLVIKEYPTARAANDFLANNPKARADDLNAAFADKSIKAIIASIGGDDSMRILPYLDARVIAANPKILMGYSDTTTLLTFVNALGAVTFHGPAIMAGFSQLGDMPQSCAEHVRKMLFEPSAAYEYKPYGLHSDGYLDWSVKENLGKVKPPIKDNGWHFLQGTGVHQGRLWGGCIEVLEFLKGTRYWPKESFWKDRVVFFETSEEKPPVDAVVRMLRNYGLQGVFHKASGVLFGKARDYTAEEKKALDVAILRVIAGEFGAKSIPIITNMDFGHTDPQFILPLGVKARIDCTRKSFELIEPWLK